jgi:CheY-like chemotaxis protein
MDLKNSVILVVEEDWEKLQVICDELKRVGLDRLLCSHSGKEAMEVINNGHIPDMIIVDTGISDMNGFKMTEMIKNINDDVIVINIVDYQESIISPLNALKHGCDDHVGNRVIENPQELIKKVTFWLEYNTERAKLREMYTRSVINA